MSHVDEGLLNAYIDGALETGTPERVEIETHLAACADCRVRLEDVLRTKNVAARALDSVAPGPIDMPPWDDIVAAHSSRSGAAGAPQSARARKPFIPLAWAASLFLALGAGWMARVMLAERGMAPTFESEAYRAPAAGTDQDAASLLDSAAPLRLQRTDEAEAMPSAPPQTEIALPPATQESRQSRAVPMEKAAAAVTITGEVHDESTGRPLAGASITVPGTSLGGVTDSAGRFRIPNVPAGDISVAATLLGYAGERRTLDVRGGTAPPVTFRLERQRLALEELVVTGQAARAGSRVRIRGSDSVPWRAVSMEEARDSLGTEPVAVPDAAPDSVFLLSTAGSPIVRMVYTIEGEIVELQQSRAVAEEDAARRELSVDSLSTATIRDLTVTLKGPPALVESLLQRLR
jgi:hypothetical protein